MTGFGVDIGRLGALPGTFSDIGETLTGAAGALGDTGGGDFGHPQLNQVVSQVSGLFGDYLSGLGKSAGGLGNHLQSTLQAYAGADSSNAQGLAAIGSNIAGGSGSGIGVALADGGQESAAPIEGPEPIPDFGSAVSGIFSSATGDSGSGPFGKSGAPFTPDANPLLA
jgi:hypothetical protein